MLICRDGLIPAQAAKPASARNQKFATSHERHFPIPHERRSREWGIVILPQLLSHEWGIGKCLEWRVGNLPVPVPFHDGIYIPIQPGKTLTNCIDQFHHGNGIELYYVNSITVMELSLYYVNSITIMALTTLIIWNWGYSRPIPEKIWKFPTTGEHTKFSLAV